MVISIALRFRTNEDSFNSNVSEIKLSPSILAFSIALTEYPQNCWSFTSSLSNYILIISYVFGCISHHANHIAYKSFITICMKCDDRDTSLLFFYKLCALYERCKYRTLIVAQRNEATVVFVIYETHKALIILNGISLRSVLTSDIFSRQGR